MFDHCCVFKLFIASKEVPQLRCYSNLSLSFSSNIFSTFRKLQRMIRGILHNGAS
jgi:hypothetical protein